MRGITELVIGLLAIVSDLPAVSIGEMEGGNKFAFPFFFLFFVLVI